ncbi:MAG: magnesium/cobalt transporter CorA [Treponema sp.]|jgi:magnesium transporter|nr:magnesium/cobalt transporter CorA [Treponema sp.]
MTLSITGYDAAGVWTQNLSKSEQLTGWEKPAGITWIQAENIDKPEEVNRMAEIFGIHPLTVEDILDHTHQRPKVEEFENYLFVTFKAVNFETDSGLSHISMIITGDMVLTFQDKGGNDFETIKRRIMNKAGRHRRMGADYLAYTIIDTVVDEYFISIDTFGSEIEVFEDRALTEKDETFIKDIQGVKRKLLKMRRAVWPLRESIFMLMRLESNLLNNDLDPFLKDLYDHVIQAAETVDTYRELIAGIMEINMTVVSNRLNQVMKVLTIISTIFIPLTFIVGVYGMNFTFMPELDYAPAYFIVWGVMFCIAIGMIIFFKRRKWI